MKQSRVWFKINFLEKKQQEWYRKMNAKLKNKTCKEEPLKLNFKIRKED